MKLVNEKGKLFGIVNVVDLFVVLFVLMVAAGVVWKVFGTQVSEIIAQPVNITYTVRIRGTFERYYNALNSYGFPQQLLSGDELIPDAYIISAEYMPFVTQVVTSDGRIVDAKDDTKIDILVTITAKVSDTAVVKVGSQEVRAGRDHWIKTRYFEMAGSIETIKFDDK